MKVADAIGAQLDWMVAKCEGTLPASYDDWKQTWPRYSTDWAQGGPIIERENISVGYQGHLGVPLDSLWYATNRVDACGFGPTPLIAAMRCYMASKLGNQINVPEELL